MTAEFVSYMEKYAYTIALRDYCIAPRASERIAMPELFDLIAGSETGAIIATMINLPNDDPESAVYQKNKYFASNTTEWFLNTSSSLYHNPKLPFWLNASITVLICLAICVPLYRKIKSYYHEDGFESTVENLRYMLKTLTGYQSPENHKPDKKYEDAIKTVTEFATKSASSEANRWLYSLFTNILIIG